MVKRSNLELGSGRSAARGGEITLAKPDKR